MIRTFDRIPYFDERSRQHPVLQLLANTDDPRSYSWYLQQAVLDQGEEGHCVGFGISHEAAAKPVVVPHDNARAHRAFFVAQRIDRERHGLHFDEGATMLAGMKAGVELGYWKAYRWAFGLQEMILGVGRQGPAVIGINMTSGMMDVDKDGYMWDTGYEVGGHCMAVPAVNLTKGEFLLAQSWGEPWSEISWRGKRLKGYAKMKFEVMERRLEDQGECAFPVTRQSPIV